MAKDKSSECAVPKLIQPLVNADARVIGDTYPEAKSYEVVVPHCRKSITITPRATDYAHGTIFVNGLPVSNGSPSGEFALRPGLNIFEICVTDADGSVIDRQTLKILRDFPTPDWVRVCESTPWAPRDSAGELVFRDRMWLIGGYLPAVVGDVWSSADGINWEFEGNLPDLSGVSVPLAYVHDDKMWVTSISRKLYCSADGKSWTCVLSELPWQGSLVFAGTLHGKLWAIGGADGRQVWSSANGMDWALVLDGAPWSKRVLLGNVVVHDEKLWVIGGSYGYYQPFKAYRDVWRSEDGVDWKLVTDCAPWEGRRWASCVSYRSRIWLLGGFRAQPTWQNFNDVWYSSDGWEWKKLETDTVWSPRHEISTYVFQDRLWVVGGNAWPLVNDVWQLNIQGLTFVTQPVVEEYVGARYEYRARADFNENPNAIRYRLLEAPPWMTVDARTGLVSGMPTEPGKFRVILEAFDDAGGVATQDFTLHVVEMT